MLNVFLSSWLIYSHRREVETCDGFLEASCLLFIPETTGFVDFAIWVIDEGVYAVFLSCERIDFVNASVGWSRGMLIKLGSSRPRLIFEKAAVRIHTWVCFRKSNLSRKSPLSEFGAVGEAKLLISSLFMLELLFWNYFKLGYSPPVIVLAIF